MFSKPESTSRQEYDEREASNDREIVAIAQTQQRHDVYRTLRNILERDKRANRKQGSEDTPAGQPHRRHDPKSRPPRNPRPRK